MTDEKQQDAQASENSALLFSRMVTVYKYVEVVLWAAVTVCLMNERTVEAILLLILIELRHISIRLAK